MYYPYLRGRQFELIALREYAFQPRDNNNIIPIIEPVRKTFNSMKLALPKLIENKVKFALILNPQVGEIKNKKDIILSLKDELSDNSKWIPAYILKNNFSEILNQIKEFSFSEVMVVCSESTDTSDSYFDTLVLSQNVKYVVSNENRTLKRKLSNKGKDIIRLDDNFNAQRRNSDYLMMPEEKFSEEHLFYKEDGYNGFSDFTPLLSEFTEGST